MVELVAMKLFELTQFDHKINQFTLILHGVGVRCDVDIFKLTASAQSIWREVYEFTLIKDVVVSRMKYWYHVWNTCTTSEILVSHLKYWNHGITSGIMASHLE